MHVLIVDDEESIRKTTAVAIESMGHEVSLADEGGAALKLLEGTKFDAALVDLKLRQENGLELIPEMLRRTPQLSVVVFTAYASIETAVEAMRRGAVDYIPKPFTPEQIGQVLAKIIQTRRLHGKVADLEFRLRADSPDMVLETCEPAMHKVYEVMFKAAGTPATILLLGESGTGKTSVARAVHERSPQRDNAFVTVSCPSLSRELLESELFGHVKGAFTGAAANTWGKVALAEGGTLFLDEIGEMPLEIQPKLLRLLQEREYERVGENTTRKANVRVIAATNKDLRKAVQDGRFREDVYYRLNVIAIRLPPLRERVSDMIEIARGYLTFFSTQCGKKMNGFSPEAELAMKRYPWPGNLRELRNAVERAVILAGGYQIEPDDLPEIVRPEIDLAPIQEGTPQGPLVSLEVLEQAHIRQVMDKAQSLEEAAQILGIDPATLYRKRKKYGF
jgi:two-component system, NtrC family, response regulator AlgB